MAPDLIIQVGPAPISRHFAQYMSEIPACGHCVIAAHGWHDPTNTADVLVVADPVDTLRQLSAALRTTSADPRRAEWTTEWIAANRRAWAAVDRVLAEPGDPDAARSQDAAGATMREGAAIRAAVGAMPRGSLLAIGNSLPVRTVDTYCPAGSATVTVLSQRGVNGIDGLVAGAAGSATASSQSGARRALLVVLGDVSFAHDLGGLATLRATAAAVVIAVIDNLGGRIFELLPIASADYGSHPDLFRSHWLTPPAIDIAAAAATFGYRYVAADEPDGVRQAVAQGSATTGVTIVHVRVQPGSAAADFARITQALGTHGIPPTAGDTSP